MRKLIILTALSSLVYHSDILSLGRVFLEKDFLRCCQLFFPYQLTPSTGAVITTAIPQVDPTQSSCTSVSSCKPTVDRNELSHDVLNPTHVL